MPFSIAIVINFSNFYFVSYSGKSSWFMQVWDVGSLEESKVLWILNFYIYPHNPIKFLNPSKGTFDVPVTNYRNLALKLVFELDKNSQNQIIT